jgi:hypothetical protein
MSLFCYLPVLDLLWVIWSCAGGMHTLIMALGVNIDQLRHSSISYLAGIPLSIFPSSILVKNWLSSSCSDSPCHSHPQKKCRQFICTSLTSLVCFWWLSVYVHLLFWANWNFINTICKWCPYLTMTYFLLLIMCTSFVLFSVSIFKRNFCIVFWLPFCCW